MRKANKVDIWMNGKKVRQTQNDKKPAGKRVLKKSDEEHAAAVDDSDISKTAKTDKQPLHTNSAFRRKSKIKTFKPFFLAAFSAIVIGSLVGFFLLNMFVDINADMGGRESGRSSAAVSSEEENDTAGGDSEAQSAAGSFIQPDSAFVLQAGKYSEKSNARSKAKAYRAEDYPGVVWKKDGFFFVLSGVAGSSQKIDEMAKELTEKNLKVYAKKWETSSLETDLSNSEEEWLQTFAEHWQTSLKQVSNGDSLSKKYWSEVVDDAPEDAGQPVADLTAFLADQQPQMGEGNKWHDQQILLSLWHKGSQLLQ